MGSLYIPLKTPNSKEALIDEDILLPEEWAEESVDMSYTVIE